MLVILLSEFFESASLRGGVTTRMFDLGTKLQQCLQQCPMSWYGKNVDINCVGAGDQITDLLKLC
ncbi:hypothetical protein GBA52_028305 [Prunus armeniaca]|nr:hypothetical protein GBA52_028305 [Prunus armeniaca]